MVSFGILYKIILDVAEKRIRKPKPYAKQDNFLKEHGYSWDYVFVFKVWDEYEKEDLSVYQNKYSMKFVIDRLTSGGGLHIYLSMIINLNISGLNIMKTLRTGDSMLLFCSKGRSLR